MSDIEKRADSRIKMTRIIVGLIVTILAVVFAAFILFNAHRLSWTLGWIYVAMNASILIINFACLMRWNPKLIRRRMRFSKFTKPWDMLWAVLFALAMIAIFVVVVGETRDGISHEPGATWLAGFAIFTLGWTLVIWSMVVNPFFEKTVRIQTDHGHHVIDTGPYAYMRHPGYVGFAGWIISTPLLLASLWAFIPALIALGLLVVRTVLEDRTLHEELPGYAEYATRVRFRLIPGVW